MQVIESTQFLAFLEYLNISNFFSIDLSAGAVLFLFVAALVAGFIDSIAGGGGMITIPALYATGIPPHIALGTNKLQACFGSFSAALHFYQKGLLKIRENLFFIFCVFIFALFGTIAIQFFSADFLAKCIPFLLIIFAFYFAFSPKITQESSAQKVSRTTLALLLGAIGAYDGFFGPGTGSFFMLVMISLGGFGITKALAHAKLFNFTSNIASLLVFALSGQILWALGFVMALGQFIGANLGSRLAIKYGITIIKPLVALTSIAACLYLLYRQYF